MKILIHLPKVKKQSKIHLSISGLYKINGVIREPVSPSYNNDLWQSYHHHVELFYDYININRDLRDLDFKKNLERKTDLCEKAEALDNEESLNKAHNELQELHEAWKEVGPVDKEHREVIWDRFKTATRVIHKKRNDYFLEIKEKNAKTAELKEKICQKIVAVYTILPETHIDWQKASEIVLELEKEWKILGRLNKSENNKAWKSFRKAIGDFYFEKNEFYKQRKSNLKSELEKKLQSVRRQKHYKILPIGNRQQKRLFNYRMTGKKLVMFLKINQKKYGSDLEMLVTHFFDKKKAHFKELDAIKIDNLKNKTAFLNELRKKTFTDKGKGSFESFKT